MTKISRKTCFSLAETLVALAIIGVVASMTISNLLKDIRNETLEKQFQKSYSIISQAYAQTFNDLGVSDLKYYLTIENNNYPNAQEFVNTFYEQLKVVETKAYSYPVKNYNNSANAQMTCYGVPIPNHYLPDGSSIYIYPCATLMNISVDINGHKKPNRLGYDIFYFEGNSYTKNKLIPKKQTAVYTKEEIEANPSVGNILGVPCRNSSTQGGNGLGCAYYALIDKNPDDPTKKYWESLE